MKLFERISNSLDIISRVICFIMMFMITVNVIGRAIGVNIYGVVELVEMFLVVIIFLSLSQTHIEGKHIVVNVIVNKFSKRTQAIIDCVVFFLSLLYVILLIWQGWLAFMDSVKFNEAASILNIPVAPFRFFIPLGSLILASSLVLTLIRSIRTASVPS